METLISFLHLLSLVCWIGSIVFFSFFAAPAVFQTLERKSAGELIGVIFPKYYLIGYTCALVALITLFVGGQTLNPLKTGFLLVMAACTLAAGIIIHPRARELKKKIQSAESDEIKKSLEIQFQSLHSLSVKLNGTVLIAGIGLIWMTAVTLKL